MTGSSSRWSWAAACFSASTTAISWWPWTRARARSCGRSTATGRSVFRPWLPTARSTSPATTAACTASTPNAARCGGSSAAGLLRARCSAISGSFRPGRPGAGRCCATRRSTSPPAFGPSWAHFSTPSTPPAARSGGSTTPPAPITSSSLTMPRRLPAWRPRGNWQPRRSCCWCPAGGPDRPYSTERPDAWSTSISARRGTAGRLWPPTSRGCSFTPACAAPRRFNLPTARTPSCGSTSRSWPTGWCTRPTPRARLATRSRPPRSRLSTQVASSAGRSRPTEPAT